MHETQQIRPEVVREHVPEHDFGVVQQPLTWLERTYNLGWVRKGLILMVLAAVWQAYAMFLRNDLLLPTFTATLDAFVTRTLTGELPSKALVSIKVLLQGYVIGMVLAMVLTVFAMASRLGNDLLETPAGHRAAAARLDLVRPRQRQHRVRARARRAVARGAEHTCRLHGGVQHTAHGGPQLRPSRSGLCGKDPGAGRAQQHPHWPEDRLGVRLADPDRS